jgi:hypothetical protein
LSPNFDPFFTDSRPVICTPASLKSLWPLHFGPFLDQLRRVRRQHDSTSRCPTPAGTCSTTSTAVLAAVLVSPAPPVGPSTTSTAVLAAVHPPVEHDRPRPGYLSSSETLFSATSVNFEVVFCKCIYTDMGARLLRCTIHANRFYVPKMTFVGLGNFRPRRGPA